jgi:mannosyltransferase OCH1-like enzyme
LNEADGWRVSISDDQDIDAHVQRHFSRPFFNYYVSLPITAMRTDIWRYAIVYEYGGLYSDLDNKCLKPIKEWNNTEYGLVIALENEAHFCQWCFLANQRKHPAIKSVLNLVEQRSKSADYSYEHFVHHLTGPEVWTDGIKQYVNSGDAHLNARKFCERNKDELKRKGICVLDMPSFRWKCTFHQVASETYDTSQYTSWKDQRRMIVDRFR